MPTHTAAIRTIDRDPTRRHGIPCRLITLTLNTVMFPVFPQNRIPAFPQVFPDLHFELLFRFVRDFSTRRQRRHRRQMRR